MGFREKLSWAMMAIMAGTGVLYFSWVQMQSSALGDWAPPNIAFFVGYVILVIILALVAGIAIGISRPSEASPPMDERERLIVFAGEVWAGRLLSVLLLLSLLDFGLNGNGNRLFHLAFASLIVSQVGEYVFRIWFYRRGV